jgi:hypothetical protein
MIARELVWHSSYMHNDSQQGMSCPGKLDRRERSPPLGTSWTAGKRGCLCRLAAQNFLFESTSAYWKVRIKALQEAGDTKFESELEVKGK